MNRTKYNSLYIIMILTLMLTITVNGQIKREIPEYANSETQEIVQKMIEAHGGWSTWADVPSIGFDNIFYNEIAQEGENPFWIVKETIEQGGQQRVHHYWPVTQSTLVFDGNETWTVDWAVDNPPKMMAYFFYYFVNLPWLTQDGNVKLGAPEKITYSNKAYNESEREVYRIKMTFKEAPVIGKVKNDMFQLYIDAESYMLVAYEYTVGYGAILDMMGLPDEMTALGPVFRHIDRYNEVNGLKYPFQMHTTNMEQSAVYGQHVLINYRFDQVITDLGISKPSNAVVDKSSKMRKSKQ